MQSLPAFLIYATAQTALAIWRMLPGLLPAAAFIFALAFIEHGTDVLTILTR
jgi:hypothetical protein